MKKIQLTDYERKLIRLCKGRHRYQIPNNFQNTVIYLITRYYQSVYGKIYKTSNMHYIKGVMVHHMLDVYLKIGEEHERNREIKELLNVSLAKHSFYQNEEGIDRLLCKLYGLIQGVTVRQTFYSKSGKPYHRYRFNL